MGTFGANGRTVLYCTGFYAIVGLAVTSGAKIPLGGVGAASGFTVARLDADGTPDPTFGTGGVAAGPATNGSAYAMAVQADGKVLLAGQGQRFRKSASDMARSGRIYREGQEWGQESLKAIICILEEFLTPSALQGISDAAIWARFKQTRAGGNAYIEFSTIAEEDYNGLKTKDFNQGGFSRNQFDWELTVNWYRQRNAWIGGPFSDFDLLIGPLATKNKGIWVPVRSSPDQYAFKLVIVGRQMQKFSPIPLN